MRYAGWDSWDKAGNVQAIREHSPLGAVLKKKEQYFEVGMLVTSNACSCP